MSVRLVIADEPHPVAIDEIAVVRRGAGRTTETGRRVTVAIVATRHAAGMSVEDMAAMYDLPDHTIERLCALAEQQGA